jgi:16S rRNA (uracil1498-N3)-methyltransferase
MKIQRFCLKDINLESYKSDDEIEMQDKEVIHQMKDVFRFSGGDMLNIFDGESVEIKCEIIELHKNNLKLKVLELIKDEDKIVQSGKLHLAFALLKSDHTEMILEKCTELGVNTFSPLITDRTIKTGFRRDRLEKIIKEATEQSGFIKLPTLNEPVKLLDLINTLTDKNIYVLDMHGENIKDILTRDKDGKQTIILIGPEGGWSDAEREVFKAKSLPTFSLGKQTLRAETAAISSVSLFSI